MSKHRRRELFRSFLESYIDPEKDEEPTEVEGIVQKILQALGDDNNDGDEQVVNLVKDFHKHYQLLYESYDHLTEELRKKADGKHGKDSSSSRSDSSDSDEKEKLHGEHQTDLSDKPEAQNTIRELNSEAEKWNDEKSSLLTEYARVKRKLEIAESKIDRLSTMQKVAEENTSWNISQLQNLIKHDENRIHDLENQLIELGDKLNEKERELSSHQNEAMDKLETAGKEISGLRQMQKDAEEEKTSLSSKISQLEDVRRQAEDKIQTLVTVSAELREKLEEKEKELDKRTPNLVIKNHYKVNNRLANEKHEELAAITKSMELLQFEKSQLVTQIETLIEEKKEAIRQLCIHSDHLREEKKELENELKKRRGEGRRRRKWYIF